MYSLAFLRRERSASEIDSNSDVVGNLDSGVAKKEINIDPIFQQAICVCGAKELVP